MSRFPQKTLIGAALALVLAGAAPALGANDSDAKSKSDSLSSFKLIYERNIFNPKRYARSSSNSERREASRTAKTETMTLVGLMEYEKGTFAFLDGSSSSFRKVLRTGASVGGLKITSITATNVGFAGETNQLTLEVGYQLRREENGDWQPAGRVESTAYAATGSYRSSAPSSPAPSASTSVPAASPSGEMWPQGMPGQPMEGFSPDGGFPGGLPGMDNGAAPQSADQTTTTTTTTTAQPAPSAGGSQDDVLRRLMQRREQEMNR